MEVVFLSLQFHGGAGLACTGGHARGPAKSCKSGVYDSGGTSYLSCSYRSCVPCSSDGICCGVLGVLQAKIWCTPTLIPQLIIAVLWLRTAPFDSFGILHIVAFVTLCEAYMGIEPHFNLWNYLFHIRLWSNSDTAAMVWGCAEIYVHTRPGIDPYFCLSVSNPSVGWQKEWFFLRSDAGALLPMIMGKGPTIQPSWGMG
jgi:hypothetical protein